MDDANTNDELTEAADLNPVADQLVAIAERLRTNGLALPDSAHRAQSPGQSDELRDAKIALDAAAISDQRRSYAKIAKRAYEVRRRRTAIFGEPGLFGEPAWDILLDLYVAHAEDKSVSVSSACIGSATPPTTGLRWLGILAEHGLVMREHDENDQRRVLVKLTQDGLNAMDQYFADATAAGVAT